MRQLEGTSFPVVSIPALAAEPNLAACSEPGVSLKGGPLAKAALAHLQKLFAEDIARGKRQGLFPVVDVEIHSLSPGMYPAVPGWHCHAVPRNTLTGQPNFAAIDSAVFHIDLTLSSEKAGVSNTEFVVDAVRPKMLDRNHVYRDLHREMDRIKPRTVVVPDGVFVKYTPKSIHRAMETHRRGWRMHMRYSMYAQPVIENNTPGSVQVYVVTDRNGW
jgi:hypothetical protein